MSGEAMNYGKVGASVDAFQHVCMTGITFDTVLENLREAIEAAKLWVLHEIDPQSILQRGGHSIGRARQILFFHPDIMIRLLASDRSALLEAPLKFAVMELPDGSVSIRWLDPAVAFGRYKNSHLDVLGSELAAACERIVVQATAPGTTVPTTK